MVATHSPSLGPQHPQDDAFTKRIRLHQSWYRAEVLGLSCGVGPNQSSSDHFGNMLTEADAQEGKNFLTPGIYAYVKSRIAAGGGAVEPYRLLHNMLSSQPMCFNLFAPLREDRELATVVARALWGKHIARVIRVEIEWAPTPREEYLDDRTAFDAFIEYERLDGGLGFVGIETKLTEPFSQQHTDKPSYRRWMGEDCPWRAEAHDRVDVVEHNQLWRDHLLAWAMLRHPRCYYREGKLVVIHHPIDERCRAVLSGYRQLLQSDETLASHSLDELVDAWLLHAGPGSWLEEFRARYLELERSEHCLAQAGAA